MHKKLADVNVRSSTVTITDAGRWNQQYDLISINSALNSSWTTLLEDGFKKITLTFTLDICEIDDGYQYIYFYNGNTSASKLLYSIEIIEHGGSGTETEYSTYSFTFDVNIVDLSNNAIYVFYDASGLSTDDWSNKNIKVSMVTIQSITPEHEYSYRMIDSDNHLAVCSCGANRIEKHAINASESTGRYAFCVGCGYRLDLGSDMGFVQLSLNQYVSLNGSYILDSGIIVLVDEDIDAYLNGTLIFYKKNELPQFQ